MCCLFLRRFTNFCIFAFAVNKLKHAKHHCLCGTTMLNFTWNKDATVHVCYCGVNRMRKWALRWSLAGRSLKELQQGCESVRNGSEGAGTRFTNCIQNDRRYVWVREKAEDRRLQECHVYARISIECCNLWTQRQQVRPSVPQVPHAPSTCMGDRGSKS